MRLIYLFKCSHIRTVHRGLIHVRDYRYVQCSETGNEWVKMICYEGVLLHHNRAFTFACILDLPQNMNFEKLNTEIRVLLPPHFACEFDPE